MKKISCRRGFTLIELLVVVLIIGILAAVALPQYQKAVTKSKVARAEAKLRALDIAQREYWLANGSFARDVAQLSVSFPSWRCDDSVNIESFCAISVDKNVTLEWKGNDHMRKAIWTCIAKSTLAQAICAEYQAQWGGGATTPHEDVKAVYYFGAWK